MLCWVGYFCNTMWRLYFRLLCCFNNMVAKYYCIINPPLAFRSSWMWLSIAYPARSKGLESFYRFSWTQVEFLYFHWPESFRPCVVFFGISVPDGIIVNPSVMEMAGALLQSSMILSSSMNCFSSLSIRLRLHFLCKNVCSISLYCSIVQTQSCYSSHSNYESVVP